MSSKEKISVIVPLYRCAETIKELNKRTQLVFELMNIDGEIIYVDDASPQNDWELVTCLAEHYPNIKGVSFSRNFGQHFAITAGLKFASGDYMVVMDGDLQDRPEHIVDFYKKIKTGFEVVLGRRINRQDEPMKRYASKFYYKFLGAISGNSVDATTCNFGMYSRKVIDIYNKVSEQDRFFPFFIRWMGFSISYIDVQHDTRKAGQTAYTFSKLFDLALNGLVSHSNKPLQYSISVGIIMAILSIVLGCYFLGKKIFFDIPVQGWSTIVVSLFFIGGLLMANMGIIGIYIGKIYDETKRRPLYIIDKVIGL